MPTHWSETGENIAWKTPVAGRGPCFADRVGRPHLSWPPASKRPSSGCCFASTARPASSCGSSVVLEARRWKTSISSTASPRARRPPTASWFYRHVSSDQHSEMVVAAYDFDGKQQWLVRPGEFSSMHGYCSCPVLFEDMVIVNGDHDGDAYLVALDNATGKTVWKTSRENKTRSYSTPHHSRDRRPHADDPLGQQVRGQLRPARRRAALDHRRADRAVRGFDGLQRQAAVS